MTVAERLPEFCGAEAWPWPAAGDEVARAGKGRTLVLFSLTSPAWSCW